MDSNRFLEIIKDEYPKEGTQLIEDIREMKSKMNEWISVNDRPPEKLEPVNIVWVNRKPVQYYAEIKDKPFVGTGYYYNGKWWWYSATCEDYLMEYGNSDLDKVDDCIEITHWQPLPQLPKEDIK